MRKLLAVIFMLVGLAGSAKGGIIDPRQNLQWEDNPEWAHIIRTEDGCTGQFIAPDLILTANHCFGILWTSTYVFNYNGEKFLTDIISRGYSQQQKSGYWIQSLGNDGFDWALLKVRDRRYYSNKYLSVAQGSQPFGLTVNNVGFGSLRKMGDQELAEVRREYINFLRSIGKSNSYQARTFSLVDYVSDFDDYLARNTAIPRINKDYKRLKIDPDCRIINKNFNFYGYLFDNNFLWHSCASVGGNSGSALVDSSGRVVGVHARGWNPLGWERSSYDPSQDTSFLGIATRVDLFNSLIPSSQSVSSSASREEKLKSKSSPSGTGAWNEYYDRDVRSTKIDENCVPPRVPVFKNNPNLDFICHNNTWWVKDDGLWWYYRLSTNTWIHPL